MSILVNPSLSTAGLYSGFFGSCQLESIGHECVGVLRRYLDLSGIDVCSTLPLFRPLVFHRSSSSYTLRGGKISYSTCREILRDSLSQLGYNPNDYGLHSLRSGGATSAVHYSGHSIPERLLK